MRFYGPMRFAQRRCVVCSARNLSLSFILSRIRLLHICLVCIAHRNTHMRTHTHRGKVPTESREESKRRPCPLQTSGSSFSSCFSPDSSRLCSFSFCLSFPLSPIGPSSGSFDWRAENRRRKKRRGERDRIKVKEREKARREGERRTGPPRSRRSPGRSFLPRHRSKRITREKKGNGSFVEDQRIYRGPFCS